LALCSSSPGTLGVLNEAFPLHIWGLLRWKEVKCIIQTKELDTHQVQKVSMPFVQAQNEIRQNIQDRRIDLVARKVLSEEEYERYRKLRNPFYKTTRDLAKTEPQ